MASVAFLTLFNSTLVQLGEEYEERVGDGQGTFDWTTSDGQAWFAVHSTYPDILMYRGQAYKFGENGHRKMSLNQLEKIN